MRNFSVIFLTVFTAVSASFLGFLVGGKNQLSALQAVPFEEGDTPMPKLPVGAAHQGAEVYRELSCASCHSRMVRNEKTASDFERAWAKAGEGEEAIERQSVPRDYIYYSDPLIGSSRRGGDLFNIGARLSEEELYAVLRNEEGAHGVGYDFLFESEAGVMVPTEAARRLVAVLINSRHN
jgi:cbb3-type cytochrome oxidase cytochrome c subunit